MTLRITKPDDGSPFIGIGYTSGSAEFTFTEHYSHLRSFWSQLGNVIGEVEKDIEDSE